VYGNITFAAIDPTSSLPASMPFLFVLSVVGAAVLFGRRFAALRMLAVGGLVGGLGVVTIPFTSQRYLSDFLPLIVVLAGAGLYAVLDMTSAWGSRLRRTTYVAFAALAVFSLALNFGLALVYQRAYSPFTGESERAAFVRFQRAAPGGSAMTVRSGSTLPKPLAAGTLFVLGNCDGVYWSDGTAWHAIERTQASGRYPLDLTVPTRPTGTRVPILEAGAPDAPDRVALEYLPGDRVRFVYSSPRFSADAVGDGLRRPQNGHLHAEITYDTNLGDLDVSVGGRSVLGFPYGLAAPPIRLVAPAVQVGPTQAKFCRTLTDG
jgi:hypothetical protein